MTPAKPPRPPKKSEPQYLSLGARVDFTPRLEGEIVHIEAHRNGAFTLTIRSDLGDHYFRSPSEVRLLESTTRPRAKKGKKK